MPRLNIDDSIYRDPRFMKLCYLLGGDYLRAIGTCVVAWSLGQAWYLKTPGRLIPRTEWARAGIPEAFLDVGLATLHEDGIAIDGAEEHFGWLARCSDMGKRGRAKQLKNPSGVPPSTMGVGGPLPLPPPLPPSQKQIHPPTPQVGAVCVDLNSQALKEAVEAAVAEWGRTLKHYGRDRNPKSDEVQLLRVIRAHGLERTRNALKGFRAEEKRATYDPAKYVSIGRLLSPDKFLALEALGESITAKKPEIDWAKIKRGGA